MDLPPWLTGSQHAEREPDATIQNLNSEQRSEAFDVIDDACFIQESTGIDLGLRGRLDLMRYSFAPDVLGPEARARESHVRGWPSDGVCFCAS